MNRGKFAEKKIKEIKEDNKKAGFFVISPKDASEIAIYLNDSMHVMGIKEFEPDPVESKEDVSKRYYVSVSNIDGNNVGPALEYKIKDIVNNWKPAYIEYIHFYWGKDMPEKAGAFFYGYYRAKLEKDFDSSDKVNGYLKPGVEDLSSLETYSSFKELYEFYMSL